MKTTADSTTATSSRSLQLWTSVRDELRQRRQARADQRALEGELAAYSTRAEVDDLLAVMQDQDGADVERVRTILTRNLQLAS